MTLQAATDLRVALSLGAPPRGIGLGFGMVVEPPQDDGVKSAVRLTIAAAVEAVATAAKPTTMPLGRGRELWTEDLGPGEHGPGDINATLTEELGDLPGRGLQKMTRQEASGRPEQMSRVSRTCAKEVVLESAQPSTT